MTHCIRHVNNCATSIRPTEILSAEHPIARCCHFGHDFVRSCSQSHEAAELFMVEYHALASSFGDVCSAYNCAFCQLLSQLHQASALFQTKNRHKLVEKHNVTGMTNWSCTATENERARMMINGAKMIEVMAEQKARKNCNARAFFQTLH